MTDKDYMRLAIQLAAATRGQTSPNPVVGAVIVKNHQIVGMGAHLKAGEPHAEIHALNMAGEKSKGATMYVTLEPCAHYGRTPPCVEALIQAGVARVVVAATDPDERVSGRGIEMIKSAGIEVIQGILEQEALELNEPFFYSVTEKQPFVTLKIASSLDGKIATCTGESKWITGEESREDVHFLRHTHDAILVGVNTVIADDPTLNTRLPGGGKNPIRIILDHHLRTPIQAKMISDNLAPVWIVTSPACDVNQQKEFEKRGVKLIKMDETPIRIKSLLEVLFKEGIQSLLVEGGGVVNDSFLRSGLFNQVVVYLAPLLIGSQSAPSSFSGLGIESLEHAARLTFKNIESIGNDLKITAVRK